MNPQIEDLIYFCTLYYTEKRDKDAIETIKELIDYDPHFDKQRRQLFQAIYKQVIDSIRSSLLTVTSYYETNLEINRNAQATMLLKKKEELCDRLLPLCREAIGIIDDQLLPNSCDVQTTVYYMKFKGDLYRYIAEYSDETDSVSAANAGEDCYKEAILLASSSLPSSDPVRLSLILNAAVFRYEIRKETEIATEMLNATLVEASSWIGEDEHDESKSVVQIMKTNLKLWCDEEPEGEE